MPLRYDGTDVRDNAVNYAVVYKLHFDGFGKNRVTAKFEYSQYTNSGALVDTWGGINLVVIINGEYYQKLIKRGNPLEISNISYDDSLDVEIICSGMSGLPVTVTFE